MQIPRTAQKIHMFLRVVIIHGCHLVSKLVPRLSKEETFSIYYKFEVACLTQYELVRVNHDTTSVILSLRH